MSTLPPELVLQGFWIDWSRGRVLGSTITTTSIVGNVIVAVLTIVISLGAAHLWKLLVFASYQFRASKDIGDGLYRQQQALLRTLSSPEQTLLDFTRLGIVWHGKARNNVVRSLIPALIAFLFLVAGLAISVSSSFIVTTANVAVLVDSAACGYHERGSTAALVGVQAYTSTSANAALDYARNCYLNETTGPCIKYVLPRIDFTSTPAPCPFDASICIGQENPGISMDTGYMDSDAVWGINAVPQDRIQARKKTTCAPIKVVGYFTTRNSSDYAQFISRPVLPGEQLFLFEYGSVPGHPRGLLSKYNYSTYKSNVTEDYVVESQFSGPTYDELFPSIVPISELKRENADTIIVQIFSNAVEYLMPVNDPVFSAHRKTFQLYGGAKMPNVTVYTADWPTGTIGCAEQYSFCVPTSNTLNCTGLGGLPELDDIAAMGANRNQLATFELFRQSMFYNDFSLLGGAVNTPLSASEQLSEGVIEALPDDQWKIEVKYWESYVLSYIQKLFTDHAIGTQTKTSTGKILQFKPPSNPAQQKLCGEQKMRVEGGFANVNVFGLAFSVAISSLLVLLELSMLRVFTLASRFRKAWEPKVDRWVHDGVLQLQRKAYEGVGEGNWTRRDEIIPMLGKDELLSDFQVYYPRSPSTVSRTVSLNPFTFSRRGTAETEKILVKVRSGADTSGDTSEVAKLRAGKPGADASVGSVSTTSA